MAGRSGRRRVGPGAALVAASVAWLTVLAACGSGGGAPGAADGAGAPGRAGAGEVATGGAACGGEPQAPTTVAYAEVGGVDPDLLSYDVHLPPDACGPAPILVWVHGGAWAVGDKRTDGTDVKAAWAAAHGWALVAVNYRLTTPGSGVTWPVHGEDVAAAVGHVLDHAGELGLDPERLALMGHSAGGHLVSIVSVDPDLLAAVGHDRSAVDCLVSLDTEGYDLVDRVDPTADDANRLIDAAFGTDPEVLASASPLLVLERTGPPVPDAVIVTQGPPRRRERARAFGEALQRAGADVTVVTAEDYDHGQVNAQVGRADDTVETPVITALLERCLA